MTLSQLMIGWFYYGIFYMGLSIMATMLINRVAKHYYTAPLVINAVSVVIFVLLILCRQMSVEQFWINLCFVYMPIVAASAVCNVVLFLIRKGEPLEKAVTTDVDVNK